MGFADKPLGRDLADIAKNFPLLIFFDSYEVIDVADRLLRIVMGAAGLRVGWVLAGRDNLWSGTQQRKRNIAKEYGYKDIVFEDRRLAVNFDVGGGGAFTASVIKAYFDQVRAHLKEVPQMQPMTMEEAARIMEVTNGVPLAVTIAAGLYLETANMELVTEQAENKHQIVDLMVERYLDMLPVETQRDIVTLFTFAPSELEQTPKTFREYMLNAEFDQPSPSRL